MNASEPSPPDSWVLPYDLVLPPFRLSENSKNPDRCHRTSWGWLHVKPGCQCPKVKGERW